MTYCPSCKITLAENCPVCPLCHGQSVVSDGPIPDIPVVKTDNHGTTGYPSDVQNADNKEKLTLEEKRLIISELLAVSFGIILTVTIGIDILVSNTLTWSKYTSLILCMLWLFLSIPLVLWGHPWLVFAVLAPALPAGLFLLALSSGDMSWYIMPALPITLLFEAVVLASFVLIAREKQKGLNCVGVILAALALFCVGIDLMLTKFLTDVFTIQWSIIVLISLFPVAGFFFYLHYRVINKASLRKLFRL